MLKSVYAHVTTWIKVIRTLPDTMSRIESELDQVRRAVDHDYRRRREVEEMTAAMARRAEVDMWTLRQGDTVDGRPPQADRSNVVNVDVRRVENGDV